MYSETCLNRSCSKVETLLRRTDTFDSVCFLYASLSRISKAKNCKEDTASDGWHFQSSDKKAPCLTRTQIKISGIFEKQIIKLDILGNFLKNKHFLHCKTTFFLISICSFEGVQHFWLELAIFYSKVLSATNQQLFLRHWKQYRPANHISPLYELLVSVLWLTLSFGEVSKTWRRKH